MKGVGTIVGRSTLAGAAAMALMAAAMIPPSRPAMAPAAQTMTVRKRKSQKRKAKAREIVKRWGTGAGEAKRYALKRDFSPARSSTLRKTQKLLRMLANAA